MIGERLPVVQKLRLALAHAFEHLAFGIAAAQRQAVAAADLREAGTVEQAHGGARVAFIFGQHGGSHVFGQTLGGNLHAEQGFRHFFALVQTETEAAVGPIPTV